MSTADQTIPSAARTIRIQRATIVVLLTSTIALLSYANSEHRRAEAWQSAATPLIDHQIASSHARLAIPSVGLSDAAFYPVTAIREDGSRQPVEAKALQVDLGEGRLLEIQLRRNNERWLDMWAPFKRDDTHVNLVVFRPHCANSFALELDRIPVKSVTGNAVTEQAPSE